MERLISALLIIVGLINFFPAVGILSANVLANAYGIPVPEGDLLILLRHRALLFGIVGAIIIASSFRRHLRFIAIVAAFISMSGFIVLTLISAEHGEKLHNIMLIDIVGVILLMIAVLLLQQQRKPGQ